MTEELMDYLELFHFVMKFVGEDPNFMDLFKEGLASILKKKVKRILQIIPQQSTPMTEASFVSSPLYSKLLEDTKNQLSFITESFKNNRLWVSQGSISSQGNPIEGLKKLPQDYSFTIQHLQFIRSINVERIAFLPEMSLFHTALFRMCLSDDQFIRAFGYGEFLESPSLMDAHQFHAVMTAVLEMWNKEEATLEFAGCLHNFLTQLSEVISGILDDTIQEELHKMVESITTSKNFATLFLFDPSLRWLMATLPQENLQHVLTETPRLLSEGCFAQMCLLLRCMVRGYSKVDALEPAIRTAAPHIKEWPRIIQSETRSLLGTVGTKIPPQMMPGVLDAVSEALVNDTAVSVFSEFVVAHFVRTTQPFHEPLFMAIEKLLSSGVASKDLEAMYVAVCSDEVRFLAAVKSAREQSLFRKISLHPSSRTMLYQVLYDRQSTALLTDEVAENAAQAFPKLPTGEDGALAAAHVELTNLALLYPQAVWGLVRKLDLLPSEDLKAMAIATVAALAAAGHLTICEDLLPWLPSPPFECEYSESARRVREAVERRNMGPLPKSPLVPGTQQCTQLALLFEHAVCAEGGRCYIAFVRMRIRPALWFAAMAAAHFQTLFADPAVLEKAVARCTEDPLYYVWLAMAFQRRLAQSWLDAVADEDFDSFMRVTMVPQIDRAVGEDEFAEADELNKKYAHVYEEIRAVTNSVFKR